MRDGMRRVTHITEITGMEGEVIITQDLFTYDYDGENADGTLTGALQELAPAPALPAARGLLRPRHGAAGGDGMSVDLIVAFAIFVAAVAVVIGVRLFVITVVLRMQARHRKRLARVGRKRLSGRLDLEDARLMLRQKKETNALVGLTEALAKVVPLLDTTRLRAKFRRAGLDWSVATFVLVSLGPSAGLTALGYSPRQAARPRRAGEPRLGMVLVDRFVKFRGGRRANRFMKQLPDAIDTIIRGIRSGLPVIECVGTVGQEYEDPVGGHFRTISERVMLGETARRRALAGGAGDRQARDGLPRHLPSPSRSRPAAASRTRSATSPTSCAPASG